MSAAAMGDYERQMREYGYAAGRRVPPGRGADGTVYERGC